jgi:hypothetical protein
LLWLLTAQLILHMSLTTQAAAALAALPPAFTIPNDIELLAHGTFARNQKQRKRPVFFVNEVRAHTSLECA